MFAKITKIILLAVMMFLGCYIAFGIYTDQSRSEDDIYADPFLRCEDFASDISGEETCEIMNSFNVENVDSAYVFSHHWADDVSFILTREEHEQRLNILLDTLFNELYPYEYSYYWSKGYDQEYEYYVILYNKKSEKILTVFLYWPNVANVNGYYIQRKLNYNWRALYNAKGWAQDQFVGGKKASLLEDIP